MCVCIYFRIYINIYISNGTTSKILILHAATTLTTASLLTPVKVIECNSINEVLKVKTMIIVIISKSLLCSLVTEDYVFIMKLISVEKFIV